MNFFIYDFLKKAYEKKLFLNDNYEKYSYIINILKKDNIYQSKNNNIENFDFNSILNESYRYNQIIKWLFNKFEIEFENMTDLPKEIRNQLIKYYNKPISLKLEKIFEEKETKTIKLKIKTFDNLIIEEVILNDNNRFTICISSQIGCPVGCKFCATGNCGFKRNLFFFEIIEQILIAGNFIIEKYFKNDNNNNFQENSKKINKNYGKPIDNIVFMGMGEPLLNLENVFASIEIFNSKDFFNISSRKITISTCGIENKLDYLFDFIIPIRISFSLHSTKDDVRKNIIPISKDLNFLINKFENYYKRTKNRVTIEYTLIKDVNDNNDEIINLIKIAKKLGNFVNLIEYNEINEINFKGTSIERIHEIRKMLEKNRVNVSIRYKRGREIKGACGQLIFEDKKF